MIEIKGVSKSYGTAAVVNDVTLSLPAGELTAVIGPNGAGKSTLLSMIARLIPMDRGTVTVDGLDVTRASAHVLAKRMAILKQANEIMLRLTVTELVAFGRFPHSHGRLTSADAEKITDAIAYVGLTDRAGQLIHELSGGQRQRAFLAMVLAQDSTVMLLDEPLNNLDMKHAAATMKLLRRAVDDLGKTVVVVIHDINFASCYADRIAAFKAGRLVLHGTPEEVVHPEVLSAIYDMEITVHPVNGYRLGAYYR